MSESQSQPLLMIRGLGSRSQQIQTWQQALDERLARCDLELTSVLRLDDVIEVNEVDVTRLRSIFLDKNPVFKDLVDQLKEWNEDSSSRVRTTGTKQSGRGKNDISEPLLQPSVQQSEFGDNAQQGEMNQINLADYFNASRSKHSHLDPPGDRIKEFTKKELEYRDNVTSSQGATRPGTVAFSSSRPLTQGSFARPSTNFQSTRSGGFFGNFDQSSRGASRGGITTAQSQFRDTQQTNIADDWIKEKRSPGMLSAQQKIQPWNYTGSLAFFQGMQGQQQQQQPRQFQTIQIKNQSMHSGIIASAEESQLNQDGEAIAIDDGQEQGDDNAVSNIESATAIPRQMINIAPSRKVFISDENTLQSYASNMRPHSLSQAKSTFINYQPSNEAGEIRLENLWFTNRNRAVKEKREREELHKHMHVWSQNKGVFDQEINQKNKLTAQGSNFQDIGVKKSSAIPPPVLSETNYVEKEKTAEEIEVNSLMDNYMMMVRKPKEEKELIGQHHQATDDSIFEIASRIDQSLRSPRSRHSSQGGADDFSDQLNNSTEKQNKNILDNLAQASKRSVKINKNAVLDETIEPPVLPERPKTTYVNLRSEIKTPATQVNPFIDLETKMKREKFMKLKEAKGKIIGLSSSSTNTKANNNNNNGAGTFMTSNHQLGTAGSELPDEEEIQRRKEQSLQLNHRKQSSSGFVGKKLQQKFRPFTSLYKRISLDTLKNEQLTEIESVRKGFAKKGIQCSLKTITQSLSRFEGLPQTVQSLPTPGSLLFTNPFNNFGKKKSSKKK